MYCKNCGEDIPDKSKYCSICGKKTNYENKIIKNIKGTIKRFKASFKIMMKENSVYKYATIAMPVISIILIIVNVIMPGISELKLNEGKRYLMEENYEKAVQAFSVAENAGAKTSETYIYLGQSYLENKDYEKAEEALGVALEEGESPEALKLISEVWEHEKNYPMLIESLEKLVKLMPNEASSYIKLAKIYAEDRRYESATLLLEGLLKRQDNKEASALLYNIYAQSYANNKALEKSKPIESKAYEHMKSTFVTDLSAYDGKAISISDSGKYLLTKTYDKNNEIINIYEKSGENYELKEQFNPPYNYNLNYSSIVFSKDESKIAFYNSNGEMYVSDSYIFIYDLKKSSLYSLTDPKGEYSLFLELGGIFIIDSKPCFSEDGNKVYFYRYSSKSTGLYEYDLIDETLTNLYEPIEGGRLAYKVIEKGGKIYFSVTNPEPNLGGLFVYEYGNVKKLNFEYDKKFYDLALWDISADGRYLLYYITISSQNNSFYFHILDLDKMELLEIYPQDIEMVNNQFVAVNYYNILGEVNTFICKNAKFSQEGDSLIIAEVNAGTGEKVIREIAIKTNNNYINSIIESEHDRDSFSLATGGKKEENSGLKQLNTGEILIYDGGLRLLEK